MPIIITFYIMVEFVMYSLVFQGHSGATTEELLINGLYRGHSYSVTGVLEVRMYGTL